MDNNSTEIKSITIIEKIKPQTIKQINCEKERKMRVETYVWGLSEEDLSHSTQLTILNTILLTNRDTTNRDKNALMFITHIKTKISGYKQQDIIKKKLDETQFVDLKEVIQLLHDSNLLCHYCSNDIYILYEIVREMKQWTLDRIDNDIGHNKKNLVIACLECNLKRKRTNKDKFMFTKNMKITREGIN
jgi:hypothetical protein